MKRIVMLFATWLIALGALAQEELPLTKQALQNIKEGRLLARLDLIHAAAYPYFYKMDKYNNMPTVYIPYVDGDTDRLIVYSRFPEPKVIYAVALTNLTKRPIVKTSSQVRDFTPQEHQLYIMTERTIVEFKRDPFFKIADNAYPKLRPVITPYGHKLYCYGDPISQDSLTFGEDYVVEFSDDNQFINKKALHKQSLHYYLEGKNSPDTLLGFHSHVDEPGDEFTATDIAKVIYYQTIAGWNDFMLLGNRFTTFWDYKKDRPVQFDRFEFETAYRNKPFHGRYLVMEMPEEKEDSGHIPLSPEMEQIVDDGIYLANLNKASTFAMYYATKKDQFLNQSPLGFSYLDGHIAKTVFFAAANFGKVDATISYDERYDTSQVKVEFFSRKFTPTEARLYEMYASAFKVVQDHDLQQGDTTVRFIIQPVICGQSQKVYVSSESTAPNKLKFGNDFYIEFDKRKDYLKITVLHDNFQYLKERKSDTANNLLGIHSHTGEADDFFTATDISKILTYQARAGWSHFVVRGKNHFCFWDYEENKAIYWDDQTFKTLYTDKPYRGKMILKQADFFRR